MIPKIVHYCWFGKNPKNEFVTKCIETWKEKLVGYEFIEWNEENFNINICDFTKKAYENKKWAFVADYVRLYALSLYGGIYLDTDIEIVKQFSEELLNQKAFMCFEDLTHVSTACIGSCKGNKFINQCLNYYDDIKINSDDKLDLTPNTEIIFNYLFPKGLNGINKSVENENVTIYTRDYFSPKEYGTKKINLTENTFCIHHFDGTWKTKKERRMDKIKVIVKKMIGENTYNKLKNKMKKGKKQNESENI